VANVPTASQKASAIPVRRASFQAHSIKLSRLADVIKSDCIMNYILLGVANHVLRRFELKRVEMLCR
jgi:hypothetical protein